MLTVHQIQSVIIVHTQLPTKDPNLDCMLLRLCKTELAQPMATLSSVRRFCSDTVRCQTKPAHAQSASCQGSAALQVISQGGKMEKSHSSRQWHCQPPMMPMVQWRSACEAAHTKASPNGSCAEGFCHHSNIAHPCCTLYHINLVFVLCANILFMSHEPNHQQPPKILPNHAARPRFLPLVAARRPSAACLPVFAPALRAAGAAAAAGEAPAAWGLRRHGDCCAGGLTTTGASSAAQGSGTTAAAATPAAGPPRSAEPRRSRGSEARGLSGPPKQPGLPVPLDAAGPLPGATGPPLLGVLRGPCCAGVCRPRSRVTLQRQQGFVDRVQQHYFHDVTQRGMVANTESHSLSRPVLCDCRQGYLGA